VHSEDKRIFKENTNLGKPGMASFFSSPSNHPTCNNICHALGLGRPDESESVISE